MGNRIADMDPLEVSEYWSGIFQDALESTNLVEIVEPKVAMNHFHLLGRVRPENERKLVHGPINDMLNAIQKGDEGFFGKVYFKRSGKLKYAWVFSVGSDDLEALVGRLLEALDDHRPRAKKIDVLESPLLGPSTPQSGANPKGKGAAPVKS